MSAGHIPNPHTVTGADLYRWAATASRAELYQFCAANDRHGLWSDEHCIAEGMPPPSDAELRETVRAWALDIMDADDYHTFTRG